MMEVPTATTVRKLKLVFAHTFRPKRMRAFFDRFGVTEQTRIIDIGGTALNWSLLPIKPRVTVVNVLPKPDELPDYIVEWIQGDGRALPFED